MDYIKLNSEISRHHDIIHAASKHNLTAGLLVERIVRFAAWIAIHNGGLQYIRLTEGDIDKMFELEGFTGTLLELRILAVSRRFDERGTLCICRNEFIGFDDSFPLPEYSEIR